MARTAKVPLFGNVAKAVTVNLDATTGAQIGTNLLLPDGTVGTLDDLRKLFGSTGSTTNTTVVGRQLDTTDDLPEGRYNLYAGGAMIEDATTARTASGLDLRKAVHASAAAGLAITIPTVAAAGWLIGAELYALQGAAGAVQFVAAAGVTFAPADSQQTRALGSLIGVKMIADDVWEAVGDLAYVAPATTLTGNPGNASAQPVNIALTAEGHVLIRRSGVLVSAKVKASEVVFTPTGNLASTDAQAALAELDSEKVDKVQLASASGAGLVGNTPAGNIAATTVQGALNELDAEKATIAGAETFAVAAGTAQAITATFSPAITTLTDGEQLKVRAFLANTAAAPTLKVNALTAYPITKQGGVALVAGDIHGVGHELLLRYVAATPRFELLNPAVSGGGGSVASVVGGIGVSVDATDPANPIVSATGSGAAAGPFTYWRILIHTTSAALANSNFFSNIAEVEMAESAGGVNVCSGGTAFASSAFSGNPASAAFDGIHTDTTHQWSSAFGTFPQWLGYQLSTAKTIKELRIYPTVTVSSRAPADFSVEGSNDGRRWYHVATFTPTNWADNTANVFSL